MSRRTGRAQGDTGHIGVIGATAIGIGGMVGGGIFAVLGVAATTAGGATPIAFVVGGVITALTAYSYARLSVQEPSAGGTVVFVDRAFRVSTVTGSLNILLWAGYIVTTALYAAAFGNYAASLIVGDATPAPWLLRGLILVGVAIPWLINLRNAGLIARSEGLVVAIKVAILLVVIVAGTPSVDGAHLATSTWPSAIGIISAGMLVFVAYEGFELIANASDDVTRPRRTLPLAFGLSVGIVIFLYVAISIVVVGSLSPKEIADSADFALAKAASASLGEFGFVLVGISAVLATFSAINATLYGSARLSYTIATEGELPERLETTTWNQPVGLHITALAGLVLAVAIPLDAISGMASAIFLVVFGVVNVAAVKSVAGRRAQWIGALGAVGCAVALIVLLVSSAADRPITVIGLGIVAVAVLVFEHAFLARHRGTMHLDSS